jgi:hypothetical protein
MRSELRLRMCLEEASHLLHETAEVVGGVELVHQRIRAAYGGSAVLRSA